LYRVYTAGAMDCTLHLWYCRVRNVLYVGLLDSITGLSVLA